MPEDAEIPDLKKKAQQRGQSGFAWSQDAAPARGTPGGPPSQSLVATLKSAFRGKAATFTVLMGAGMGLGLGVFGVAMFEIGEPDPAKGGGLPGLFSSLKVRPGGRDRMRYLVGKTGLFSGLVKGPKGEAEAEAEAAAEQAAAEAAASVEGGEAGEEAPSAPQGSRATNSGAYMGGATAAASLGGGPGSRGTSSDGAAAPQFNPSSGRTDIKGSRKVRRPRGALSVLGERRETKGTNAMSGRTMASGNASARGAGTQSSAGAAPSSLDYVVGGSEAGGAGPAPAAAAGSASEGGEGGGSSPEPGGAGGVPSDAEDPDKVLKSIQKLLDKSTAEGKKAEKEKKIAAALALAGQHPQAAFHYMRGEKAEKKSKEYAAQAQKMASAIGAGAQPAPQGQP